jgi:Superinfection immunity protein
MTGMVAVFTLAIVAGALCLYFLPWGIAAHRHHPNIVGIAVLNFFLGWSLIGWVIALIWAVSGPRGDGPTASTALPQLTKRCPACAEEVLAAARKCKHCGEIFDDSLRAQ